MAAVHGPGDHWWRRRAVFGPAGQLAARTTYGMIVNYSYNPNSSIPHIIITRDVCNTKVPLWEWQQKSG